jgi:MFS family permease
VPRPPEPGRDPGAALTDDPDAAPARIGGLLGLTLLTGTVNGVSRVALPLYAASVGAQAWQVGLVGGMGYTGMLLLALPMGALIDRHGSRAVFVRGVLLAALLYLLVAAARLPWQVILATACIGLVLPMRAIPIHTEFLALLPLLSPTRAGWNRAANMTGMFFLGPAISAAAIAAWGFTLVFCAAAAGLASAGLIGRRVLGVRAPPSASKDVPLLPRIRSQLALLREEPGLRRTMGIDFLVQIAVAYFVVFGVVLAVRRVGMPLQAAAGLVTLQGAIYVVTLLLGGRWIARWPVHRLHLVALSLLAVQCALFGLLALPVALWCGAAVMGVAVGIQGLLSTRQFAEMMRLHGRGRIGGLTSLAAPAGGVLGAIGGGALSQQVGPQPGFVALALACALMAAAQWRGRTDP